MYRPTTSTNFSSKSGIARHLERLGAPRFEAMVAPDPCDRVLADAETFGHHPSRPVRRAVVGQFFSRHPHDLGHRSFRQPRPTSTSRSDSTDTVDACLFEATTPTTNRVRRHLQLTRDLVDRHAVRRHQQRLGLEHGAMGQRRRPRHAFELAAFSARHRQRWSRQHRFHATTLPTVAISATDH